MVVLLKKQLSECSKQMGINLDAPPTSTLKDNQVKLGGGDTPEPVNLPLVYKSFFQFTEKVVECFPIFLHSKKPVKEELTEAQMDAGWKVPEPEQPFEKLHQAQEASFDEEEERPLEDPFVNGVFKLMEYISYMMINHFQDTYKTITYDEIMDQLNNNEKNLPSEIFLRMKQYAEKKQQDLIATNMKVKTLEQRMAKHRKEYYQELELL